MSKLIILSLENAVNELNKMDTYKVYQATIDAINKCTGISEDHKSYILKQVNSACVDTVSTPKNNCIRWIEAVKEEFRK